MCFFKTKLPICEIKKNQNNANYPHHLMLSTSQNDQEPPNDTCKMDDVWIKKMFSLYSHPIVNHGG
jgi:hypothetical protein